MGFLRKYYSPAPQKLESDEDIQKNEAPSPLLKELEQLQAMYQACIDLKKRSDYKDFSPVTRKHEAMALKCLKTRITEIQGLSTSQLLMPR